jgi:hypothetical protein
LEQKITADNPATEDYFGSSVGISGATVIVGASFNDSAGSAYIFGDTEL